MLHYRGELRPGWGFELTLRAAGRADSLVLLDAESEFLVADRCPEIPVIRLPNIFQPPRLEEPDTAKGQGQRQNIVFGGRVTAAKGVPQLIKACREIADLDVHLLGWVDPKLQSLLEESSRRGSETWLHVHGAVEYEVFLERLRLADLLVLPSLSEGFPNVVLEAMASGTAVVATRVGAVEEVLGVEGDHPGGVCCPPNDIGALRNAIETLLNDPGRRRQMGDNGRERVRDFYGKEALIKLTQHWKALVSTPEVSLSDASLEPRSASRSRPT